MGGESITKELESTGKESASTGNEIPPLFHGRVKLHKVGESLRPIVSTVGSCTYKVAKGTARVLAPYCQQVESYIQNTKELVEEIKSWRIEPDEILVSFDVKLLFTSADQ